MFDKVLSMPPFMALWVALFWTELIFRTPDNCEKTLPVFCLKPPDNQDATNPSNNDGVSNSSTQIFFTKLVHFLYNLVEESPLHTKIMFKLSLSRSDGLNLL